MQKLITALLGILVAAAPAAAQDHKAVDVNAGFGGAFPFSALKNDFDTGWNGAVGITFNFNTYLGIQAEYIHMRMNGLDKTISVSPTPLPVGVTPEADALTGGVIQSTHQMHVGSFNLVYKGQAHSING